MNQPVDLLAELEALPARQLMNFKWRKILTSYSIVMMVYSTVVKCLEFDLLRNFPVNDRGTDIFFSGLQFQLTLIIGSWTVFSLLISTIPIGFYTYRERLKPMSIILMVTILSVTALIFTLSYYEIKNIISYPKLLDSI